MRFKFFLNEMDENSIGLVVGRFQPPHIGHKQIFERVAKNHNKFYILLVKGAKSSKDKKRNPFPSDLQKEMLQEILPNNGEVLEVPNAFIPKTVEVTDFESNSFVLYAGPDRAKKYEDLIDKMPEGTELSIVPVNFDRSNVSASTVREALKHEDFDIFKKVMPDELLKYWETLLEFI